MKVVVAGDVVVDHHVYEGERSNPAATESRGVSVVRELGGAKSLCNLIDQMCQTAKTRFDRSREDSEHEYQEKLEEYNESSDPKKVVPDRQEIADDPLESCEVAFGLTLPNPNSQPCGHHGLAIFKPYPKSPNEPKTFVWRASTLLGYGHDNPDAAETESAHSEGHCDVYKQAREPCGDSDVLVLDDAAFMFRKSKPCWMLDLAENAKWIILKISSPVCRGDLWEELKRFRSRLIVVVAVTELRPEEAGISEGLSWERTVEELASALANDLTLQELMTCRHVVISFSADGCLWLDNPPESDRPTEARLVHDASSIEGQWAQQTDGALFGFLSCMVAAVTKHVIVAAANDGTNSTNPPTTPDLITAISSGLTAMRNLRSHGHGTVSEQPPMGYPVKRLAEVICDPPDQFSRCLVPWQALFAEKLEPLSWSIAIQSQLSGSQTDLNPMPMSGLAQQVVLRGRRVLQHLPNATFGGLFTVDRAEIETLRTLRQLMKGYRRTGGDKPLSIGVFGPPGAGKSFGVKQIAKEIFGKQAWLEFNLSQFNQVDLIGALHQVRDKVLDIGIPVVFWDEFDSKNYDWLQYLLAPMQDGRFQDGQINHAIGSCVFIFAGATSHTFQQFGPSPESDEWREFKLRKGPDFMSRLDGYYNVLGPNPRQLPDGTDDSKDTSAPIRRALLLRNFLCGGSGDQLQIDPGLLRALLEVPTYTNGARSLQKMSQSLKPKKPVGPVRRSDLCSPTQLAMFVDFPHEIPPSFGVNRSEQVYRKFMELCRASEKLLDKEVIEKFAEAIHTNYQEFMDENGFPLKPPNDKPYKDLPRENKDSNLAAARRIPFVLAIAGLELRKQSECGKLPTDYNDQVKEHIAHHLEIMSELEHDLWMEERYNAGWRYGEPRDDDRRMHNRMVPYQKLPEHEKDKDRDSVREYIKQVSSVDYRIAFIGTKI